jgi:arylsulfatase
LSGQGEYNDAMVEHDNHVGLILDKLDELGIADDTIVMYSTDNGPHYNTWPDGAITPFASEKNSNWEGAYRVPCFVRWPGKWRSGVTLNGIVALQDLLPTFLSAAGDPDIVAKCRAGHTASGKTYKVALDGKDMNAYFSGATDESPREEFFYVNDDAELVALRVGDWKLVFKEQRAKTLSLWAEPFVDLRIPRIFNLRRDPFERALENSNTYWDWMIDHAYMVVPAQVVVARAAQDLAEFPPRQRPASFNLDQVLAKLTSTSGSA